MTLEELHDSAGPNKHDQALVLIQACIFEGSNTAAAIRDRLVLLGLNGTHVLLLLHKPSDLWTRNAEGLYELLD